MILKKGIQVKIISGKDKGKTGEILEINRKLNKVGLEIYVIKWSQRQSIQFPNHYMVNHGMFNGRADDSCWWNNPINGKRPFYGRLASNYGCTAANF